VALCCFAAGCGTAATVVAGAQSLEVPDPAPGTINVALLRFDLDVGTPVPVLRRANGYRPPKTAVFVAGVAPDPTLANGYVGLVAIADFKGAGQQGQRRTKAGVSATQEFSIEFAGDAAYARNEVASYEGLGKHGNWTVSWDSAPNGTSATERVAQDGSRLLDEIASQLQGSTSPALLAALAGQPPPPVSAAGPGGAPGENPIASGVVGGSLFAGAVAGAVAGSRSVAGSGAVSPLAAGAQPLLFPSTATGPAGPISGEPRGSSPPVPSGMPSDQPPSPAPGTPTPAPSPRPSPTPGPSPTPPPGPVVTATVVTVDRGPGAADPGTVLNVSTSCPGGSAMTGGGAIAASPSGENASRGLVLVDAMPVGPSGSASSFWGVGAAPASGAVADAVTEDFVVCLVDLVNGSLTNVVVAAAAPGPSASSPVVTATATCPAGTVLVGGGGGVQVPAGSAPSVTLTASFPSTPRGGILTSGGPSSWSAVGVAGPGASGATTSASALCVAAGTIATPQIVTATAPVPPPATGPALVTASCPAGSLLLSGGFAVTGGPVADAHVRGSYPSDAGGFPASDAPVAGSWSSIAESDGPSPSTSTVFALCAG
jgi:hypothetical protein